MRLLITAGPTREALDAVRFLSNRSSGKLGIALALYAARQGHATTLLLGPGTDMNLPADISSCDHLTLRRFESCADLQALLGECWPTQDALVMAAAVADYRPAAVSTGKLPRQGEKLILELEPTPDLAAQAAQQRTGAQVIVAFALEEPALLLARARQKLERKGVDAIVGNPLRTMDAADIEPTWLTAAACEQPGPMSKTDFAAWLLARVEQLHAARTAHSQQGLSHDR